MPHGYPIEVILVPCILQIVTMQNGNYTDRSRVSKQKDEVIPTRLLTLEYLLVCSQVPCKYFQELETL